MDTFTSSYTGQHIDEYQERISMLENAINNLNLQLTSIQQNYATKTAANSLSMVPSNSYTTITRTISDNSSSWRAFMNAYTAPTNGYLNVYFTGCSNTPSFQLTLNSGMEYRGNGNGSRDVNAIIPVAQGQTVNGSSVYCYPSWIRFYGVKTI